MENEELDNKISDMRRRMVEGKDPLKVDSPVTTNTQEEAPKETKAEGPRLIDLDPSELEEIKRDPARVEGKPETYSNIELELMAKSGDLNSQLMAQQEIQSRFNKDFIEKEKTEHEKAKKAIADKKKAQENSSANRESELKEKLLKGNKRDQDRAFSDLLSHRGVQLGQKLINVDDVREQLKKNNGRVI